MRNRLIGFTLALPAFFALTVAAQDEKDTKESSRFGFEYNHSLYPQKEPDVALRSIVKAIDGKRIDYLIAQMADPKYVDAQVDLYKKQFTKGKDEARAFLAFDRLVKETAEYFLSDPLLIKDLRHFARDGKWDVADDLATGTVKEVPARKVFLRKVGERWYLENRQQ